MNPRYPSFDPGRMVHQVLIQYPGPPIADASGSEQGWLLLFSTYAAIDPVKGTDVIRSGQTTTQLFVTVTIFWQEGVLSDMRVISANGNYVIQSIDNPGERNVLLILNCLALGLNE